MKFSQPVKLGNASSVDASFDVYKIEGGTQVRDGVSKFGSGEDSIYFFQSPAVEKNHYGMGRSYAYGSKNLENTFLFLSAYGCEFTQIKTDENLTLYMVHEWEFDIRGEKYILLGRLSDGSFVKYFDSRDLKSKYFGESTRRADVPGFSKWYCEGDTVVLEYKRYSGNGGEFRFKWDDAAQWFSIEQIVY